VQNYAAVEYRDIYPGVDVVFHGDNQWLEFDFNVARSDGVLRKELYNS